MKSWNEIRKAATAFSKRWKNAYDEKAQAQSFLKEFFAVFGADDGGEIREQDPVNRKAAEQMARLHDAMRASPFSSRWTLDYWLLAAEPLPAHYNAPAVKIRKYPLALQGVFMV